MYKKNNKTKVLALLTNKAKKVPLLNVHALLGLIQADGNLSYIISKDRTLNPRVILTTSRQRSGILLKLKEWLKQFGINSKIDGLNSAEKHRSINLVIERIGNVKKFMNLISDYSSINNKPLLFDSKLTDYLGLKLALHLNDEKNNGSLTSKDYFLKLIDLIESLKKDKIGKKYKTREDYELQLGFQAGESVNAVASEWNSILKETSKHGSSIVSATEKGGLIKLPNNLRSTDSLSFINGVMQGDGSYQVNILTHKNHGKAYNYRRAFEFKPLITLTTQESSNKEKPYLFSFIEKALNVSGKYTYTNVEKNNKACRLVIIKHSDILQFVNYMKPYESFFEDTEKRMRFLGLTILLINRLHKNTSFFKIWVKFIYNAPYLNTLERKKTYEEVILIIDKAIKPNN